MVYSLKGYKTQSVTQLVNIFFVVTNDLRLYDGFRLLSAYLFLEAKQEATEKSLRKNGHPVREWNGPTTSELRGLVGGRKGIGRLWQSLEEAGLVTLEGNRVRVTETPLPGTESLLGLVCGLDETGQYKRSTLRAVPIPHEWWEHWTRPTRSKVVELLHLFYCGAALSFKDKVSGEVKNAAAFKFEALIRLTAVYRSRLTRARRVLIEQGRISKDRTYVQWLLNSRGHYAAVYLNWYRVLKEENAREMGRPISEKCSGVGRPCRDTKHSSTKNVGKHQKQAGAHFEQKGISIPSPKNVQLRDIRKVERLYQLFRVQHWISRTEANWRLFVGAAIRAGEVHKRSDGKPNDAVRVFIGIVKRRLWKNISICQEERGAQFAATFEEKLRFGKALWKETPGEVEAVSVDLQRASEVAGENRQGISRLVVESLRSVGEDSCLEIAA